MTDWHNGSSDWDFYNLIHLDEINQKDAAIPRAHYTTEMAIKVCTVISVDARSLKQICASNPDFPDEKIIHRWRVYYPAFAKNFNAAKKCQAQILVDEIIELVDDPANCEPEILNWSKSRVSARQWLATKLLPKIYGDKQQVETVTTENTELKAELSALRAKLAEQAKSEY